MRAISPVIATLLLILLTLSISYAAFNWYNSLREETEGTTEAKMRKDLTRAFAEIEIIKVNTSSSQIYIQNTGGRPVHNVSVRVNGTMLSQSRDTLEGNELWVATASDLSSGDIIYITTTEGVSDRYAVQ